MNTGINSYEMANLNSTSYDQIDQVKAKALQSNANDKKELSVEEHIQKSAVEVSLSMGAQIILMAMEAQEKTTQSTDAQKTILDFLSGKKVSDDFNLSNTGYEGKPITELSQEEATDLVGDDGFFGIEQTSSRVADFVLGFSGNDLDKLEAGRKGIVQGFKEAEKMWGGELPQISYDTQARTLELIDAKIAELKNNSGDKETQSE